MADNPRRFHRSYPGIGVEIHRVSVQLHSRLRHRKTKSSGHRQQGRRRRHDLLCSGRTHPGRGGTARQSERFFQQLCRRRLRNLGSAHTDRTGHKARSIMDSPASLHRRGLQNREEDPCEISHTSRSEVLLDDRPFITREQYSVRSHDLARV